MAWLFLVLLPLLAVAALFVLAHHSRGIAPAYGLEAGRLRPCPDTPNCVSSEPGTPPGQRVEPLASGAGPPRAAWSAFRDAVEAAGGEPVLESEGYLAATFRSPLFGFVDDLEARLDRETGVIHVRSASRVGRSDLGANRARIERIAGLLDAGRGGENG
ncbi:MAG: DUF1499 domain-containing protein [Gammaproteobacteria bacterium]|nr:DUF1499 domain-containing protein [Gammaproteobacteria bacterium]